VGRVSNKAVQRLGGQTLRLDANQTTGAVDPCVAACNRQPFHFPASAIAWLWLCLSQSVDMFWTSRKSQNVKRPNLAEGLAALERCGIRKRDDVSVDDILYSTGGNLDDPIDYPQLLCVIGSDVERHPFRPKSDDLWHFDTECIVDDGDYLRIAGRLVQLSKGTLAILNMSDHVSIEESVAWLEFEFLGKRVHWDFEVQDDWVDAGVFSQFVRLFHQVPSDSRFTYGDLGGQDCLIGFSTEQQRRALTTLTGVNFEWLT
jgi:hypothetical protein